MTTITQAAQRAQDTVLNLTLKPSKGITVKEYVEARRLHLALMEATKVRWTFEWLKDEKVYLVRLYTQEDWNREYCPVTGKSRSDMEWNEYIDSPC